MNKQDKRAALRKHSPEVVIEEDLARFHLNLSIGLRRLREDAGLDKTQMAKASGLSWSKVDSLESSDERLNMPNLLKCLAALDAEIHISMGVKGQMRTMLATDNSPPTREPDLCMLAKREQNT